MIHILTILGIITVFTIMYFLGYFITGEKHFKKDIWNIIGIMGIGFLYLILIAVIIFGFITLYSGVFKLIKLLIL